MRPTSFSAEIEISQMEALDFGRRQIAAITNLYSICYTK